MARWSTVLLGIMIVVITSTGCGRDATAYAWTTAMLDADRLLDHGDLDAAERQYNDLYSTAPDQRQRRMVILALAAVSEGRRDWKDALVRYRSLWHVDDSGELDDLGATALWASGRIWYWELHRPDIGLEIWRRTMLLCHDEYGAEKAWRSLVDHYEDSGDTNGAQRFIAEHYPYLRRTSLGDNLLYVRARLGVKVGDLRGAIAALHRLLVEHPASGLRDDARWDLAEIALTRGDLGEAMLQLRLLAEDREASWYVGEYDSSYADDARYRRGQLFFDELGSPTAAEEEWRLFLEEHPESIRRDDARWNIVQARLLRRDAEGARDACRELADAEPESRYVSRCDGLLAGLDQGRSPESLLTGVVQ